MKMELFSNISLLSLDNGTLNGSLPNETYIWGSPETTTLDGGRGLYPFAVYEEVMNESLADEYNAAAQESYLMTQEVPKGLVSLVMFLHLTFSPILCIVGIVGNSFCVAVFLQDRLRGMSFTVYMVAILLAESVFLLTMFHEWITDFRQIVDSYQMGGWCQFITMVHKASSFVAQWCTLALVVDRYISTCRPEWEAHYSSPVKANIVCVSIVIVAVIIYLNLSMIHGEYDIGAKHYCMPLPDYKSAHQTLSFIEVSVNCLLLYSIITSLTSVTIAQCIRQRARSSHPVRLTARSASAMVKHTVQDNGGNESHHGIFCIFMSIYLAFSLPAQCVYVYSAIYNLQHQMLGPLNLRNHYLYRVFLYIQYVRVLFNVPLFIIGYRRFRYQLKMMCKQLVGRLCCCDRKKVEKDIKLHLAENGGNTRYLSVIHRDCESEG